MALPLALRQESAARRMAPVRGLGSKGDRLRIHEIYASVQGEGTRAGLPCAFVRTTGCHLRCQYCDSAHAFHGGAVKTTQEVVDEVVSLGLPLVLVTGGEPLLQRGVRPLLSALCDAGQEVLLETSGAVGISGLDPRVVVILDVKTPGSGEAHRNLWSNLACLRPQDELKFVICHEQDYRWACSMLAERSLAQRATVLFSPERENLNPAQLAEWIVRDRLPVRFQLQLHKVLWGDVPGV